MYLGLQLSGKLLGWAGASFFAFCAVPQVMQTLREGHARNLNSTFLWMWFGGAILCAVGTVLDVGVVPWLLFNYSLNFACVSILLRYKLFPRSNLPSLKDSDCAAARADTMGRSSSPVEV